MRKADSRKNSRSRSGGLVRAVEPQEVEGDEAEFAILFVLNPGRVFRAGGQDRDGSLEGMARDRVAGVDDGLRTDEFAVEDGANQVLEAGGEMRQVSRELAQPEGDFGDGTAGDANAVFGDVKQCPDAVLLLLDAVPGIVPFDSTRFVVFQIVPVPEEHRFDLLRQQPIGVLFRPDGISEGEEVRLFGRSSLRRHDDAVLEAKGLEFGQGFRHGSVLMGVRTDYPTETRGPVVQTANGSPSCRTRTFGKN